MNFFREIKTFSFWANDILISTFERKARGEEKLFEDLSLLDSENAVPDMEILNERYFYHLDQKDFQIQEMCASLKEF